MAFKPTSDTGEVDPNIYRGGRSPSPKKKSNKELGRDSLLKLFRKVKPHTTEAIKVAALLMNKSDVADATRLRAAMFLVEEYEKLTEKIYQGYDPDEEGDDSETDSTPVFHLRVVDSKKESED